MVRHVRVPFYLRRTRFFNLTVHSIFLILMIYFFIKIYSDTSTATPPDDHLPKNDNAKGGLKLDLDLKIQKTAASGFEITEPHHSGRDDKILNPLSEQQLKRTISWFPDYFYPPLIALEVQHFNFHQFDPRLLPTLYISMINREISANKGLSEGFSLPFNWNMLTGALRKLQENSLYEEIIKGGFNCEAFERKLGYTGSNFGCESFPENGLNVYGLNFKIIENIDKDFKQIDMRKLFGNIYCLTSLETPRNIIFLGSLGKSTSLIIPAKKIGDGKQDLKNDKIDHQSLGINVLLEEFIEHKSKSKDRESILQNGILGVTELQKLVQLNKSYPIPDLFVWKQTDDFDPTSPLYLDQSLFEWNLTKEIESVSEENVLKTHLFQAMNPVFEELKHFGEARLTDNLMESSHMDWRFFNGYMEKNDSDLHLATVHRLLRSWFKFCQSAGIYTWISHGSLIGYYWNGFTLPYDHDIDVQVPIQSLYKLTQIANNSVIFDMSNDGYKNDDFKIDSAAEIGLRSYYLDVSPTFASRSKVSSRNNLIDARFIDINTGLFIDITALALFNSHTNRDPFLQGNILEKMDENDKVRLTETIMFDEFYNGIVPNEEVRAPSRKQLRENIKEKASKSFEILQSRYLNELPSLFEDLVNCRNYHFYNLKEFLPLIPTYYENTLTYIPSNWFKNLVVEYDKHAIYWKHIFGYNFIPNMNMWISGNLCFDDNASEEDIKNCLLMDESLRREYNRLEPYIKKHKELLHLNFPFEDLKEEVKNIEDTFAIKHYDRKETELLFKEFDNGPLRPEPWIAQNFFQA